MRLIYAARGALMPPRARCFDMRRKINERDQHDSTNTDDDVIYANITKD